MLSKCLNPRCSATFQYLGQGRLFRVDFAEAGRKHALANDLVAVVRNKTYPMEHFWLCERCAATMTVERGGAGEVHLISRGGVDGRISNQHAARDIKYHLI